MKKYWKITFLSIFILLTFGGLYIQAAVTSKNLPEFKIVTVSGNDKVKEENLIITGNFQMDQRIESFEITNEGTLYARDLGYFERGHGIYQYPAITRLIEEERSFMRGKYEEVNLFYEDDEKVYYIGPFSPGTKRFELDIEILDKTTGSKEGFTVIIPEEGRPNHMNVREVQLVNENLHVFTNNYKSGHEDIYLYEIDLSREIITNHEPIIAGADNINVRILNGYGDIHKKPYLVFNVDEIEWNEETSQEKVVHGELFAYNVETGEKNTIELSDKATKFLSNEEENLLKGDYTVKDDYLYFSYHLTEGIQVEAYHLNKGILESTKEIKMDEEVLDGVRKVISQGEKLYVLSCEHFIQDLFVFDLNQGELIYQGEVKMKNKLLNTPIYDFEVYNVYEY